MLKSVRDLEKLRVVCQDGVACGRIKDLYFNDQNWTIKNLVFSVESRQFGAKQLLLLPRQVRLNGLAAFLDLPSGEICTLPRVGSVLPVCRQYASLLLIHPARAVWSSLATLIFAARERWQNTESTWMARNAAARWRILSSKKRVGRFGIWQWSKRIFGGRKIKFPRLAAKC